MRRGKNLQSRTASPVAEYARWWGVTVLIPAAIACVAVGVVARFRRPAAVLNLGGIFQVLT